MRYLFFLFVGICITVQDCGLREKYYRYIPQDLFEEGDIVFRKGNSVKSRSVLEVDTAGIYSHVGIVVRQDTVYKVVHITPGERKKGENVDKIKLDAIEVFFSSQHAQKGKVIRLKNTSTYPLRAAQQALAYYQQHILFDHAYRLEDTVKMYCTELVWRSYLAARLDVTNGKRSVVKNKPFISGTYIFPSDIGNNELFETVYEF